MLTCRRSSLQAMGHGPYFISNMMQVAHVDIPYPPFYVMQAHRPRMMLLEPVILDCGNRMLVPKLQPGFPTPGITIRAWLEKLEFECNKIKIGDHPWFLPYYHRYAMQKRQNPLMPNLHRDDHHLLPTHGTITQVWHENLEVEFTKISNLLNWPDPDEESWFLASIDTEFPGTIFASDKGRLQDPRYNYEKMKENVNATNIIQLGLIISDGYGNWFGWEFNFSDFDIETDAQAEDSIELLKTHGMDFERNKMDGIPSSKFADLCLDSGLVGNSTNITLTWVGFQCSYDFGYFTKILTRQKLPDDMHGFMTNVKEYFGPSVHDVKHMIRRWCPEVYGGLGKVAQTLGVDRAAGTSHMAGSDSLLTLQTFLELVNVCLKPADRIHTLRTFTKHLNWLDSHYPPCLAREMYNKVLIRDEEEREKEIYNRLYDCKGALCGLAS